MMKRISLIRHSMMILTSVVLLWSSGAFASDWVNLYSNDSLGNHVSVDFNFNTSELKFIYDKPKVANKRETFVYQADTPEKVAEILTTLSLHMKNKWSLRSGIQEKVLTKVEEIKYLNSTTGKVLHFTLNGRTPASNRKPAFSRSVPLFSIRLESSSKLFQMRAVLDEALNIEKYSLVSEDKDMENFDIIRRGEFIGLADKKTDEILFFFRVISHSENEKDVIFYNRLHGIHLEDYSRERYSLKLKDSEWAAQRYSESDHEFVDFTEEVVLTLKSVGHEPVVRVEGSDKYFPSFTEDEIAKLLESLLKVTDNRSAVILFQNEYHNCMIENYQTNLVSGRNPDQDVLIEACKKVAVLHVDHMKLIEASKKSFEQKALKEEELKKGLEGTHAEYLSCLVRNDVMSKSDFHSEISVENLMTSEVANRFLEIALDCKQSGVARTHVEEINRSQPEEPAFQTGTTPQRDFVREAKQITEESYVQCRKTVGRKYSDFCRDYSDMVKSSVLFEQAHLSLLGQTGLGVFKKCITSVQAAALNSFKTGKSHEKVLQDSNKGQVQCASSALKARVEEEGIIGIEAFIAKIDFIKSLGIRVSSSVLNDIKSSVLQCLVDKSVESLALTDLLARHDENLEFCRVKGIKDQIPLLYKFVANIRSSKYTDSKENIEYLEGRLSRNIKRQIEDIYTVNEINDVISKDSIFSYSLIISKIVMDDMTATFDFNNESNVDLYQFKLQSFEALEKKINILIGNNSGGAVRSGLLEYFKKGYENNNEWGVEVYANEFILNFYKERSSYHLYQLAFGEIKDTEIIKSLVDSVQADYVECFKDYSPNKKDQAFFPVMKKCEKVKSGGIIFRLAKDRFEIQVANHYPKNSIQASKVLNPIHYMNQCIKQIDKLNGMTLEEYRRFAKACTDITQIDIAHNINLNLIDSYKPVIRGDNVRKPWQLDFACQKDVISKIHTQVEQSALTENAFRDAHVYNGKHVRPISDLILTKIRSGKGDGSLLMYLDEENQFDYDYKHWDNLNIKNLLATIARNDAFKSDQIKTLTDACLKQVKDELYLNFKDYIISVVPAAVDTNTSNSSGETHREVLEKIIDLEMIDLIIKFKSLRGDADGVLNSSTSPLDRVVTPAMGIEALANMVVVVGSYISKGFIFDSDRMKTELVVFKSEFKNALHWLNNTSETVRVRDLERFFVDSKVADHLALAEISENVYRQFMNFVTEMEREDFEDFKRRTGNRSYASLSESQRNDYTSLRDKYRKLKTLVKQMTSSYDFRRVMRTGSRRGEKLLEYIKVNYLLVQVLGDQVTSTVKRKIGFDVARLIVEDNTEGGFAEQFVKNVAQHSLNVQSNSKWSITKWLFYDKGDFDWSALRRTTAGRKALTYYCEYILLPKMLNANLSRTVMRQRTENFESLLKEAQGQN
ncbi:MAG: hypothetical protein EP326_05390 [Deltaproteobacteria bacterium]|nr:MAG: hypothetical protein EP326_05390 [Deltaproteobacteria bacterium]